MSSLTASHPWTWQQCSIRHFNLHLNLLPGPTPSLIQHASIFTSECSCEAVSRQCVLCKITYILTYVTGRKCSHQLTDLQLTADIPKLHHTVSAKNEEEIGKTLLSTVQIFARGTEKASSEEQCMTCKWFPPSEICSSVWGLWKVLCLDGTYIRPFSSSCEEKEDLYTSLYFWLLQLPIPSFHCLRVGTAGASKRIQNPSHSSTFALFISTGFSYLFVVARFPITLRNIQLFVENKYSWKGMFYILNTCN